jgi:glucokinase
MQNEFAIGIDLGGTNIKALVIDREGKRIHQTTAPTGPHHLPEHEWQWKSAVRDVYLSLKKEYGSQIKTVGLSAPGIANTDNSAIHCMPGRLFGLEHFNWSNYFGEQVWVLNDAHSALMAEAQFGVAKGRQHVVLLTLGTGVGGGILINGELYQGMGQVAGHLGHLTLNAHDDHLDITAMPGSLEDACGDESIARRSHGRFQSTLEVVQAYQRGDYFATWLWLDSVRKLAIAISSIGNIFSPELVVLGGGITKADDALFKPLAGFMDLFEWRPGGKSVAIVKARFMDFAGAMGSAGFAFLKNKN